MIPVPVTKSSLNRAEWGQMLMHEQFGCLQMNNLIHKQED